MKSLPRGVNTHLAVRSSCVTCNQEYHGKRPFTKECCGWIYEHWKNGYNFTMKKYEMYKR